MLWQHGEKELEKFLKFLNCYHPTIKLTTNYSREEITFLDVSVRKKNNQLVTDLYIKPTDTKRINIYILVPVTLITQKNPYLTVRHYT